MAKLKLMEIEPVIGILNPILVSKCKGSLAWELINLIDELEPENERISKLKKKLLDENKILDEDGKPRTKMVDGNEIFDFGENSEKVEEELKEVLESEIEVKNQLSMANIDNSVEIEPINLKFLLSKEIIKK